MGRFSLGFAFFALAGAFFPCFGRDFFFFFFGFLGAFGSWDSGDSWGSAGAGSAAGSAGRFLPLGGLPAVGFRRFRSGLLRRFLDGFRGGGSFGFLLYRTLFLFGLFLLLLFGLAGSEDLPADFRGGFRGLEVLHGSGGIHRLGFGFLLILRGLKALIFFRHGASSFLAY